jgi:hypothetical protein
MDRAATDGGAMTDARREAVKAWMYSPCGHGNRRNQSECPDCLLAFAAERVREENEACAENAAMTLRLQGDPSAWKWGPVVADMIRARREGWG